MRSRYSRRKYSVKYGSQKSDSIDDEDLTFLESLIYYHKSYIDNFHKRLKLDITLLSPKYQKIYETISENFPIVKISENQSDLYRNLDLVYEGEEFHYRNIREQIIDYLNTKKHQIFTTSRVEFFLKIIFSPDSGGLRKFCREIVFNFNPQKQTPPLIRRKTIEKSSKIDDSQLPKIQQIIRLVLETEQEDRLINDAILHRFAELETLLHPFIEMAEDSKPVETDIAMGNEDGVHDNHNEPVAVPVPCQNDDDPVATADNIIEISDGDDPDSSPESPVLSGPPQNRDMNEMIDFLLHRCSVSAASHPSLLRDHQICIELNGFLLFVNFAIRFALRFSLGRRDRFIFECIFASALITGFAGVVTADRDRALRIDRLTHQGFRVLRTRLRSMQLSIERVDTTTDLATAMPLYSVVVATDIGRLVSVTLEYVRLYRETGTLCGV